jgi:hypothetical protein
VELVPGRLWTLWDMLQGYFPIYKIALEIERLRRTAGIYKDTNQKPDSADTETFQTLIKEIHRRVWLLV